MLRRIDPYNIRLFIAAAQTGSIVRAAGQEHIAASALGRRLSELERSFGTALLERSSRGVVLTDAGRIVLERGVRMEEELQSLLWDVQNLSAEVRGTVRLYANMSAVVGFLPERLRRFTATHAGVHVSLHEADTRDVIHACQDDRADLGIGVEVPEPAGLDTWHFASDPLQIILPRDHALVNASGVRFADVLREPLIGVHHGGALDRLLHERAEAMQKRFAPQVSVSSFDAVCRMVEAGMGIAVIPESAASAYAGNSRFVRKALQETWAPRRLSLYARRRNPQPRAVQALIEALKG